MSEIQSLSFSMEDPNYEAFKKKVDGLNEKYCFW